MSISMKRYNDTIITPKDDRILFDQIFDDYGLIYGGSATMAASNKIHVGAARGFIKGTEVIVEAEDIAVNLSDSGTKNGRLKIVMDLADTETPIKFESEVAASFPALEQDANINYDNGRYEVVFATYKATETTISSVALVMPTMQSVKAKIQGINQSLKNTVDLTTYDAFAAGVNKEFNTYAEYALNNPSGDIFAIWDMRLEIFRSYARIHGAVTPKAALGDATHLYGLFNLTNYGIKPKGSGVTVIPFDYPIAKFTHVDGDNNIYCNPLFFKINPTGYVEGCVDKYNLVKNTGYCDITFPVVFIA